MIVSIGIDIIEVDRIQKVIARTRGFVERVFTNTERLYCLGKTANSAQHFAARFAAKEAMLKALGTGWSGGIAWKDIEVDLHESGAPFISLYGITLDIFKKSKADTIHLSMSHTRDHAVAQVILERIG